MEVAGWSEEEELGGVRSGIVLVSRFDFALKQISTAALSVTCV